MHSSEYPALLAEAKPRSIRTEADAARARATVDGLIGHPEELTDAERELLGVLGDLLYVWESEKEEALPRLPPLVQLKAMMEDGGHRQADLVRAGVFPNSAVASEVLVGKRGLTYRFVERLAEYFQVSPALFYPTHQPRRTGNTAP